MTELLCPASGLNEEGSPLLPAPKVDPMVRGLKERWGNGSGRSERADVRVRVSLLSAGPGAIG